MRELRELNEWKVTRKCSTKKSEILKKNVRTPIRFKKCPFMSFLNRTRILSPLI